MKGFPGKIENTLYDICIIGGGASGAGTALDAALRGYKVLLLEKEDFGSATSSKSTKLVHGGVRYLEQAVKQISPAQLQMVTKALRERAILLRQAPHLTRRLALLTPCRNHFDALYYYIGLKIYEEIGGTHNLGKSVKLSGAEAIKMMPALREENLKTAVMYYDGQLDDARFNWAIVETAIKAGADAVNHAAVVNFLKDESGKINAARVRDTLSSEETTIRARYFINCAGPFADAIRKMANAQLVERITVSRGVHIVLPLQQMPRDVALLIPSTRDGRVLFAIPYKNVLLAGTTDERVPLTDADFGPSRKDVEYLLDYLNDYLDLDLKPENICGGFGGLRPLIKSADTRSKDLVRDHEVEIDPASGLISLLGGKWTTYRLMARDTADAVDRLEKGDAGKCPTANVVLEGGRDYHENLPAELEEKYHADAGQCKHLVRLYGDKAWRILHMQQENPQLAEKIIPDYPYTAAELRYVMDYEMARTPKDVIARRWTVQLFNLSLAEQLLEPVTRQMAAYSGWDAEYSSAMWNHYAQELETIRKGMSC